ncbi:unnamed protein product [Diplocarpon coronariae]
MRSRPILLGLLAGSVAYTPLGPDFLRNLTAATPDLDPVTGRLLSPILVPRVPGSAGHAAVQHHLVDFFRAELPRWKQEWFNSTAVSAAGAAVAISNLVVSREPPWTKPGQANWLTLAAHYDSPTLPAGAVGAADGAVPCAILMHVARSMDRYLSQMHDEMDALGEGGTLDMDMAVKLVFLDGTESLGEGDAALFGSRALSTAWEAQTYAAGAQYPNTLSSIRLFVLLDCLGAAEPTIPSYDPETHWVLRRLIDLEARMRRMTLLESRPRATSFTFETSDATARARTAADDEPFQERDVPCLYLAPDPLPPRRHTLADTGRNLDMPTVRDWAKIVTGFVFEWLDMMEVWPESAGG